MRRIFLIVGCCTFIASSVQGEMIVLKNGRVLEGNMIGQTDEYVTLEVDGVNHTYRMAEVSYVGMAQDRPTTAPAPVVEAPVAPAVEALEEPAVELPAEPAVEAPAEPVVDVPAEPTVEPQAELPIEAPVEADAEIPTESATDVPAEVQDEMPLEMPADVPAEEAMDEPVEVPAAIAQEMPAAPPADAVDADAIPVATDDAAVTLDGSVMPAAPIDVPPEDPQAVTQ